jgi:hypothetical protein
VKAQTDRTKILTQMGAIVPVAAMNIMVMRGLNIILLMHGGRCCRSICAPLSALFKQTNQP